LIAPGGFDRAGEGPEAHKLFEPEPLHEACCKGHLEETLFYLDKKGQSVDLLDGGGRTPLHFACGWGHADVVEELLRRECALEIRDMWSKAPVDWALQAKQDKCIELLRLAAVKRNIWGGKGKVAPLMTMHEFCFDGKTTEELQQELIDMNVKTFARYEEMDKREAQARRS